ncbi:MAG: FAD:protein FMN transferase [Planctomycetaceae bacterium]|nr:FAD:protein FMN transferase [Planctomycetaceae bacterium]
MTDAVPNRRDFLTGRAVRSELERRGDMIADAVAQSSPPSRGPTLMLRTAAMATDFDVLLNPDGPADQVSIASDALDQVHRLEDQLTAYRDDSELMRINREAATGPVAVEPSLFALLSRAIDIAQRTDGAFDPASGALVRLWQQCRREGRLPTAEEVAAARERTGCRHVGLDHVHQTISLDRDGVEFNLGAIGKGYAVDRIGEAILARGVADWLVHGGKSSVRVAGCHAGHDGWPIGLQNPLLPDRPVLTLLLKDAAISTSGTAVQWFRVGDKRYGHVLDPRTGWPVETMLSVSVIAPDAALADALSTAFFVLGVENALRCCDNFPEVGAILFPLPADGRTVVPILHNLDDSRMFWTSP